MGKLKKLILSFTDAEVSNLSDLLETYYLQEVQYMSKLKDDSSTDEDEIIRQGGLLNSLSWTLHKLKKWKKLFVKSNKFVKADKSGKSIHVRGPSA